MMKAAFIVTLLEFFIIRADLQNLQNDIAITDSIQMGTDPKRLEMAVGDHKNITCYTGDIDSRTIYFLEKNRNTVITQPSEQIIILNNTTAVLKVHSETEYSFEYQCMSGKSAIGSTIVHIGNAPTEIKDFTCRGYNFEYMTCSFTKTQKVLPTNYIIRFADNDDCKDPCSDIKVVDDTVYCNLTDAKSDSYYVRTYEWYHFNITASNAAGSRSDKEVINNFKSIKPAKLNIKVDNVTTNSVNLTWRNEKAVYYKLSNLNLTYEICLKPKDLGVYYATNYENCNDEDCNILINNLQYPGYEYGLSVRVKLENTTNDMWSEPFNTTFQTKPAPPSRPPNTAIGSFYTDSVSKLQLFWQQLEVFEHYGPGFRYIINETDLQGNLINSISTNETTLQLLWNGDNERVFHIKSSNDCGDSNDSSILRVPKDIISKQYYEPHTISKVFNNSDDKYILSWKPPSRPQGLLNYTIFWCTSKPENLNECKGSINFKTIDKNQINFTTQPQQHRLNLAVSANYVNYTAGMHWALCTTAENVDITKLAIEIKARTATSVELKWNPDPICTSVIKGYNLKYCEIDHNAVVINDSVKCLSKQIKINIIPGDVKSFTIKNLKPYSKYCINMLMYSKLKSGPPSDDLIEETLEAAPSAPRELQVNNASITSNSVNVSWLPPLNFNGKIKHYTINIEKSDQIGYRDFKKIFVNTTHDINQRLNFTIESLSSYTRYLISVTATTVEDSIASSKVAFTTMIGIPTNPQKVYAERQDGLNQYSFIKWEAPVFPSGRLEFYVVAMIIERDNETVVKTSLTTERACYFRFSDCNARFSFKVRAVNFASKNEVDYRTFPINSISEKPAKTALTFECSDSENFDERYLLYDAHKDTAVQHHKNGYSFFSSPWQSAGYSLELRCNNWDRSLITYLVATIILMLFIAFAAYSIFKKYKSMKNIHVVLPSGLADHLSQSKYNGSAIYDVERPKDVRGSNDCLIKNKENLRLLAAQRQVSSNASEADVPVAHYGSDVPKQNIDNAYNYSSDKELQSEDSLYDEQLSSRSTDSVDINDASSLSYTKAAIAQKENISEAQKSAPEPANNIKITPNLQQYTNLTAPTQAPNGYVMFLPAQNNGGYIKADSLHQTLPIEDRNIVPLKNSAIQIQEELETDLHKSSVPNNNNNSKNNNNMYVSQAQLAELGRCSQVK